jgi:hypothetical protein
LNSQNFLRALFILLLATIVATTQPSSATAPDNGPNASGEGQFRYIHVPIDYAFSFDVRVNKNGKGKGWARFDNLTDQTHILVKIDCVRIAPFEVTMSGAVQHSDDPNLPKGMEVGFTATDNHPGFGDRITPPFVSSLGCEFEFLGLSPLTSGEIRIEP